VKRTGKKRGETPFTVRFGGDLLRKRQERRAIKKSLRGRGDFFLERPKKVTVALAKGSMC